MYKEANAVQKRICFFFEGVLVVDKKLLGDKGADLCQLYAMSVPVPAGFVITSETCNEHLQQEQAHLNSSLINDLEYAIYETERRTSKTFGCKYERRSSHQNFDNDNHFNPLLLAVRSGTSAAVTGKNDIVLGVGMNDEVVNALIAFGNSPIWVYDTYRRFLQDFAVVVLDEDNALFEAILSRARKNRGVDRNNQLLLEDLEMVVEEFKQLVHVPSDPWIQLRLTITALYNAWDKPSAKQQRINMGVKLVGLPLIVQSMVFGNKNFNSGSGVVYTRNPRTGDREVCGKYFVCGQGNEPQEGCGEMRPIQSLQYAHIELYDRLYELMSVLERHYKDMQEIDFTFEDGQLFVLQTSNGRRSLVASLKILTSFVDEGHLSEKEALMRIQPTQMRHFLTRTIDPAYKNTETYYDIGKGRSVTEGVVTGCLVFSVEEAQEHNARGEANILCTDRDDPQGFEASDGVIQIEGYHPDSFKTLRHLHKVAIIAVHNMHLDKERETLTCRREAVTFHRDDLITLDGYAGIIYKGDVPTRCYIEDVNFLRILRWANHHKRMLVKAIVRDEENLHAADLLDADGILVARTEPYMPEPEMVREVFVSSSPLRGHDPKLIFSRMERKCQRLVEIFRTFRGRQVTFRLSYQPNLAQLFSAQLLGSSKIKHYPPGYTTSPVEAIVTGVVEARRQGIIVTPCILIPDYHQDQLEAIATLVRKTFSDVAHTENIRSGASNSFEVGVMVESVRGCLVADSLVAVGSVYMDSVCFCADHITESFFGDTMSTVRPAPKAMQHRHTIMTKKPYADLETQTVGDLIRQSIQKCLCVNPSLVVNVTGERCGDLSSVQYINWLSANTIVCPASLVPVVKIAAAQAQIKKMEGDLVSEDHQN